MFGGAVEKRVQHFSSMQVLTSHLRVEEGGLSPVTEGHILISDVDTKQERLLLLLQRQPQHGVVELDGIPMNEGDRLSCGDLRTLAVRLEEWMSFPLAVAESLSRSESPAVKWCKVQRLQLAILTIARRWQSCSRPRLLAEPWDCNGHCGNWAVVWPGSGS